MIKAPCIGEIRRQRRALLTKRLMPNIVYLGPDEWRELVEWMKGALMVPAKGYPESFEGLEVVECFKPGVHVCERAL